jgi:hypothetical protein
LLYSLKIRKVIYNTKKSLIHRKVLFTEQIRCNITIVKEKKSSPKYYMEKQSIDGLSGMSAIQLIPESCTGHRAETCQGVLTVAAGFFSDKGELTCSWYPKN